MTRSEAIIEAKGKPVLLIGCLRTGAEMPTDTIMVCSHCKLAVFNGVELNDPHSGTAKCPFEPEDSA